MAEARANIHASCVALAAAGRPFGAPEDTDADTGILIVGASGSGKSDLALRLIAMGAVLVADDRTEITLEDGRFIAAASPRLAGLIEIRNAGIVALPHRERVPVGLVAELGPAATLARLPEPEYWVPPDGFGPAEAAPVPLLRIDPFEASAPAKIAAAAVAFLHGRFRGTAHPDAE